MFKKVILLCVVISMCLCFGCSKGTETNIGKGKVMHIEFESNPTTGFDWGYSFLDGSEKGEIVAIKEDYVSKANNGMVGVGGTKIYDFKATKEGPQSIVFTYRRPWEGGEVAYDVVYELNVDSDLNIIFKSKMKGSVDSDKELSSFPDPTFNN